MTEPVVAWRVSDVPESADLFGEVTKSGLRLSISTMELEGFDFSTPGKAVKSGSQLRGYLSVFVRRDWNIVGWDGEEIAGEVTLEIAKQKIHERLKKHAEWLYAERG